jgi:hypothetical protein
MIFFFFFDMSISREGGGRIRTSDLRFMRRGLQPIELLIGDKSSVKSMITRILYQIRPQLET